MSARQVRSAAGPLAAVVVGVLAFGAGSEIRAQRASEASTPQIADRWADALERKQDLEKAVARTRP